MSPITGSADVDEALLSVFSDLLAGTDFTNPDHPSYDATLDRALTAFTDGPSAFADVCRKAVATSDDSRAHAAIVVLLRMFAVGHDAGVRERREPMQFDESTLVVKGCEEFILRSRGVLETMRTSMADLGLTRVGETSIFGVAESRPSSPADAARCSPSASRPVSALNAAAAGARDGASALGCVSPLAVASSALLSPVSGAIRSGSASRPQTALLTPLSSSAPPLRDSNNRTLAELCSDIVGDMASARAQLDATCRDVIDFCRVVRRLEDQTATRIELARRLEYCEGNARFLSAKERQAVHECVLRELEARLEHRVAQRFMVAAKKRLGRDDETIRAFYTEWRRGWDDSKETAAERALRLTNDAVETINRALAMFYSTGAPGSSATGARLSHSGRPGSSSILAGSVLGAGVSVTNVRTASDEQREAQRSQTIGRALLQPSASRGRPSTTGQAPVAQGSLASLSLSGVLAGNATSSGGGDTSGGHAVATGALETSLRAALLRPRLAVCTDAHRRQRPRQRLAAALEEAAAKERANRAESVLAAKDAAAVWGAGLALRGALSTYAPDNAAPTALCGRHLTFPLAATHSEGPSSAVEVRRAQRAVSVEGGQPPRASSTALASGTTLLAAPHAARGSRPVSRGSLPAVSQRPHSSAEVGVS